MGGESGSFLPGKISLPWLAPLSSQARGPESGALPTSLAWIAASIALREVSHGRVLFHCFDLAQKMHEAMKHHRGYCKTLVHTLPEDSQSVFVKLSDPGREKLITTIRRAYCLSLSEPGGSTDQASNA
jgi:hypothetical protein